MPTAPEEMARRSLASVTSTSRSAHYRVYLHLSTEGAWVGGGHAIPLRLLGPFLSDGVLQPVWETEGRPVSVGRRMRILPARTRRLIEDRDRGCRFPGCTATGFVEIHHLDAWADGGRTDEDRQVSLCTIHHDGVDRGDYTITGDPTRPDGLVVINRYGLPIKPPTPTELSAPPRGRPTGSRPPLHPANRGIRELARGRALPRCRPTDHFGDRFLGPHLVPRDDGRTDWLDDPDDGLVYDSYRRQ